MGDLTADALPWVSHEMADTVDRRFGDMALEPGSLTTGIFWWEAVPEEHEAEYTVPFDEKFRMLPAGFSQRNSVIRDMDDISSGGKLGQGFGDGRWIDTECRCNIRCPDGSPGLKDEFEVFHFPGREGKTMLGFHAGVYARLPE